MSRSPFLSRIWFCSPPWLADVLSLPVTAVDFVLVLFCVLRSWVGFLPTWGTQVVGSCVCRQPVRLGAPKHGQREVWVVPHFRLDIAKRKCGLRCICSWGRTSCYQLSGKLPLFWLLLGVALDRGRVVSFAPS